MISQKQLNAYVNRVRKKCPMSIKGKITTALKADITDYLDEYPDSTIEDIISRFGTAEKFSSEYVMSLDEVQRNKVFKTSKFIKWAIITISAVLVLAIGITAVCIIVENSQSAGYYYYYEIEE